MNNCSPLILLEAGMKILITGAFGNVGISTAAEFIKSEHTIRFFAEVNKKYAWRRVFIRPIINLVRKLLFLRSGRYVFFLQNNLGQSLSKSTLYLKYLFRRGSPLLS